ncbi:MAG: YncE family protein [Tannerellaceae bacterium]|jgi:YVTN family beta-propeller protein|nr:YncE family protein [Tannerellaceae bacterium]
MKKKKIVYLLAAYVLLPGVFNSCSKDDNGEGGDDDKPAVVEKKDGVFILNRGNYNENNASLAYYNLADKTMTPDVYRSVNGHGLGDSAEQILIYGSKMYVTVTSSNRIAILDETGLLIKSIEPKDGTGAPMNPRRMAANDGKVYVGYYYGHSVAALDTASLEVTATVAVGRYPEGLAVSGNKLYVANSGGLDYPDYGHTVSVVNLNSFTVEKEIEVALNPTRLAVGDNWEEVYLISMGNYGDVGNTLQHIDRSTGQVTQMGGGSIFTVSGLHLYVIHAQWGSTDITYRKYSIGTGTAVLLPEPFITDGTVIGSPSAIGVDPLDGKIYITDWAYGSTSTLYVFSPEGKLETKVETEGYDSGAIAFYHR